MTMHALRATYRLQLHAGFDFDAAAAIVPYLRRLGVSHAYTSPYLQAARGSTHGYDVVDHSRVNDELGGSDGHARLCAALEEAGLGHVLDIVPNHMAIGPENRWWWDVLENGEASRYARHFDIDWDPPERKLRGTILLPILGDHYGRVLEAGDLQLAHAAGRFTVRYHEHEVPVAPESLAGIVGRAAERAGSAELTSIAGGLRRLPAASDLPGGGRARPRHLDRLRRRLERESADPMVSGALDEVVAEINQQPDDLDALLDAQHYRLARWQTASRELDYRRFFDVNTLIGLRTEDPVVFDETHALLLEWLDSDALDGVRIDHPDGLRRPGEYFARLRDAAPSAWIVAEKILEPGEPLRDEWPIDGTTGYDFLNDVLGAFVDAAGVGALQQSYARMTSDDRSYADVVHEAKHLVLRDVLGSDVQRLTQLLVHVCEGNRRHRDHTRHELHDTVQEVLACFDVYRTYVDESASADAIDAAVISRAIAEAAERRPDIDAALLDLLARLLAGDPDLSGPLEDELRMRFQQATGPVMAKSVEDTAFYRYVPYVALNEVGGDPSHVGGVAGLHARNERSAREWPRSMLALSTHDTKRSEDVRARLALLSEIPEEWDATVRRWDELTEPHRSGDLPDRAAVLLLYQTLVGAHPLSVDRAAAFMEKATREAKLHTSWTDPATEYDAALRRFVECTLADDAFLDALERFVRPLVEPGRVTSLAQKLVQLTSPGIPDVYQGTELWDHSLVDPDNRRPVDYELLDRLLREVESGIAPAAAWARPDDGLPKLLVVHRALHARVDGTYEALHADGPAAHHLLGFVRGGEVATLVPRLVLGLAAEGGWKDTTVRLPPGRWTDALGGDALGDGEVLLAELFERFPVALLRRAG